MGTELRSDDVGQEDGFEQAYRAHFAPLMRVAFLLTGSNAAAEDAVHEVFLRCAGRLDTLKPMRPGSVTG